MKKKLQYGQKNDAGRSLDTNRVVSKRSSGIDARLH